MNESGHEREYAAMMEEVQALKELTMDLAGRLQSFVHVEPTTSQSQGFPKGEFTIVEFSRLTEMSVAWGYIRAREGLAAGVIEVAREIGGSRGRRTRVYRLKRQESFPMSLAA